MGHLKENRDPNNSASQDQSKTRASLGTQRQIKSTPNLIAVDQIKLRLAKYIEFRQNFPMFNLFIYHFFIKIVDIPIINTDLFKYYF